MKSKTSYREFGASLVIYENDRAVLKAGKYMLMVDMCWNDIAETDPLLKEILIKVTPRQDLVIKQIDT